MFVNFPSGPADAGLEAVGRLPARIDDALAQSLNLPLVDRQVLCLYGGKRELNAYLAHIVVPALSFFQCGIFYGFPFNTRDGPYRAVLGRTFLRDMILVYDGGTGTVRIARQPSAAKSPHTDAAPQQAEGGPERIVQR